MRVKIWNKKRNCTRIVRATACPRPYLDHVRATACPRPLLNINKLSENLLEG
jgi:hypothetical protein